MGYHPNFDSDDDKYNKNSYSIFNRYTIYLIILSLIIGYILSKLNLIERLMNLFSSKNSAKDNLSIFNFFK